MNKLPYTPFEIKKLYEGARDKREQIRILAQLCLVSEKRIAHLLKDMGCCTRQYDEEQARKTGNLPLPAGVTRRGESTYQASVTYKERTVYLGSYTKHEKAAKTAHAARRAIAGDRFETWYDDWKKGYDLQSGRKGGEMNQRTGLPVGVALRSGKFAARITYKSKSFHLGTYEKVKDAAAIVKQAQKELERDNLEQWYAAMRNRDK